jgi:FecR protein
MMPRSVAALLLLAAFVAPVAAQPAPTAPNLAGNVELIEGDVAIFKSDKSRQVPGKGDPVFATDVIVTGATGEVHFTMADGGYIAVRPNTRIRIAQYQANGDDDDKSIIGIVQGSLRVVSGWIGKFNPRGYQVRSSVATVGIRGTDHETLVRPKDSEEGEAGLYDRVYAGRTFIQSKEGRVEVSPGRAGFHSSSHPAAPRVLDRIPAFFKPTRNERLIEGKHDRIQSQMQQLRNNKRKARGLPAAKPPADAAKDAKGKARQEQLKAAEKRKVEQARAKQAKQKPEKKKVRE